jgi:homoserine/homoserine lactone efflux protein
MQLHLWLAFIGAAFAISLSPGAGAILSMATGLTHGVRRTYWAILGLQIGLMTQLVLVAVGLGALVASSVLAFTIVKWLGVAYLVYLAISQWRSAEVDLQAQLSETPETGRWGLVVRGALVNLTNPKGLVFLLAVLPQFVVPTAPLVPQYLTIGTTMVVADLIVMGGYAALAARLMRWMTTARQQRMVNRVFSGLFAAAAVGLSLMRRAAA